MKATHNTQHMRDTARRLFASAVALVLTLCLCPLASARAEEASTASTDVDLAGEVLAADASTDDQSSQEQQETDESASGATSDEADDSQADDTQADGQDTSEESQDVEQTQEGGQDQATDDASTQQAPVVSVAFIGPESEWARVASIELWPGANAWDASLAALDQSGMTYEVGTFVADDVLVSLARSDQAAPCATDLSSGSAWHLWVNGERYQASASTYVLEDADELEWRYEWGSIVVSVSAVGPGGTGQAWWIEPTDVQVAATGSAWDASLVAFEQAGYRQGRLLSYEAFDDGSVELESLASLGSSGVTGERWQVFVNGVLCENDAAHVAIRSGDTICWCYVVNGTSELPAFVENTAGAVQSPAVQVSLAGVVSQAWVQDASDDASLAEVLDVATGIVVSGQDGARSLMVASGVPDVPLAHGLAGQSWETSLSYLLAGKLSSGQGGRAAFGDDGCLYYLDGAGSIVKLELS